MKETAFTLVALIILLAGCNPTGNAVADETIQIGGIFALTQYGSVTGIEEMRAAQLAVDEINKQEGIDGRNLALVVEDSQTNPTTALTAFRKLTQAQGIKYVLGPTWEASTASVVPAAAQQDVVLIATSSYSVVKDSDASNVYAAYPPYEYEIQGLIPHFKKQGHETFGIIHNEEFYGEIMKGLFAEEIRKQGWEITGVHSSPVDDNDFRSQLLKLKGADVIYAPLDYPMLGQFMRQVKELGIDAEIVALYTAENPRLVPEHADALDGLVYARPLQAPGYDDFEERYEQRYGEKPADPSAAVAYDAVHMLAEALKNGANNPDEVAEQLSEIKHVGASNIILFTDENIVGEKRYVAKQILNAEFVTLQ